MGTTQVWPSREVAEVEADAVLLNTRFSSDSIVNEFTVRTVSVQTSRLLASEVS